MDVVALISGRLISLETFMFDAAVQADAHRRRSMHSSSDVAEGQYVASFVLDRQCCVHDYRITRWKYLLEEKR